MTVCRHPDESLLLALAGGKLDPATMLIMATHLSFCAQCRALVALGERLGGVLLEDIQPAALAEGALAKTMSRLESPQAVPLAAISPDGTPPPLRAFLGRDLSDIRWRRMGPRLGYATLYRRGPVAMRLLRGAPGSDVGRHSHRGAEYTLVLRGGFTDETGSYAPGDFQAATAEIAHNPVADPGEACINLAVTMGGLRFQNPVQTFVAALFGF